VQAAAFHPHMDRQRSQHVQVSHQAGSVHPHMDESRLLRAVSVYQFKRFEFFLYYPRAKEVFKAAQLPPELVEIPAESRMVLDERSAEKVIKLARCAEGNDEGSPIAKRHVQALAKRH